MPVGKRIYLKRNMPSPELVAAFSKIPTANIADVMERSCAMNPSIRLMSNPQKPIVAGVALTVKSRAGDNLTIHAALDMAQEGDFLVVSNQGERTRSLMGDIMMAYLFYDRKATGLVLDGPIRDIEEIKNWDFPIYATGTTPGGPYKEGPGEVNVPISCGDITVNPGDIIVADEDGVIVIPLADAEHILAEAHKLQANDTAKFEAAKAGKANRAWVEVRLKEKGYEIIDDIY